MAIFYPRWFLVGLLVFGAIEAYLSLFVESELPTFSLILPLWFILCGVLGFIRPMLWIDDDRCVMYLGPFSWTWRPPEGGRWEFDGRSLCSVRTDGRRRTIFRQFGFISAANSARLKEKYPSRPQGEE
ncbi:hypothetical protein [Salininema proteolyticum]|uniref:PH domain-containing protein n=1 Tax=Salininema proteolyticum TaxID=1607685 RepID=A0ABV8U4F7_9ACTN